MSSVSRERESAFTGYIATHGKGPVLTRYGNYTFEGAAAATRSLLGLSRRPDAIFCASDYMAFAALDVAKREFGLALGKDLSIVGIDDVAEARHVAYDLTTFSQPPAALAREAIAIIDAHIAKPRAAAERREVHGELVVRGTARVPGQGIVDIQGRKIWSP
jgi:DNA-binding LacI/PurR family transcriptional regulator